MDWTGVAVLGLFVVACLLAVYQSRTENWTAGKMAGTVIFLFGVAIGLFLDDIVAPDSALLPWVEPIGAVVAVAGLLVGWISQ